MKTQHVIKILLPAILLGGCMKQELDYLRDQGCTGGGGSQDLESIAITISNEEVFELGETRDIPYTLPENAPHGIVVGLILEPESGGFSAPQFAMAAPTAVAAVTRYVPEEMWTIELDTENQKLVVTTAPDSRSVSLGNIAKTIAIYSSDGKGRTAIQKIDLKLDFTGVDGNEGYYYEHGVVTGICYHDSYESENDYGNHRVYYIMSLVESETTMAWSSVSEDTGCDDPKFGDNNLKAADLYQGGHPGVTFPAFDFCAGQGDGWYLPSVTELEWMVNWYDDWTYYDYQWFGNRDFGWGVMSPSTYWRERKNALLAAVGGMPLRHDWPYWSSTQGTQNFTPFSGLPSPEKAFYVYFNDGFCSVDAKLATRLVRPVRVWVDMDDQDVG